MSFRNRSAVSDRGRQRGLTLIELIVVLFILAAVAGIAIASFPGFQKLTHGSTSANSIRGVESAIAASALIGGQVGDGFDGLVTSGGLVPTFIANADGLDPFALTAAEADALNELGITSVFPAVDSGTTPPALPADTNATLEGHDYTGAIAIATGSTIAELDATKVTDLIDDFNLTDPVPTQVFAFGLGQECSLVGAQSTFKEAPLHTPGEGSAATRYGRYVLLVGYDGDEAFYIGVTCIDDFENFNNISANFEEYFEASGN